MVQTIPDTMTREELECELQNTLAELDEVEEMRRAVLGQTGVHVGMRQLRQYRARFERDQARLGERAAQLQARLAAMEQGSG